MQLYNTMTRTKEKFVPLEDTTVKLYSCGLTVYDEPHIGNWSAYIVWDVLVRVLRDYGYEVVHVQNYTDVGHLVSDEDSGEDKMITTARSQRKTAWEVADFYIARAEEGMLALNIEKPTHMPRATDFILQQISFVKELEDKGYTYIIPDEGVYFDTSKLADYGKLARLDIHGLRAGTRVDDTGKKNSTDFALWKLSPKNEQRDMEWDSPWGTGFPGWHLECSVMIREILGDVIDIHTGGIDHIPVHHTNEIAQSETLTGNDFVRYWLHRNFIKVDGHKMSKSRKNFYTLDDITAKGFTALDFRMLVLQSSYHTESNFSWDNMLSAHHRLKSLQAFADLRFQHTEQHGITQTDIDTTVAHIKKALQDDLNTPEALSHLSNLESKASTVGIDKEADIYTFLEWIDTLFGLDLLTSEDLTHEQKVLLENRAKARHNKDWNQSDSIRDSLRTQGIEIRDNGTDQIWSRT